MWVLNGSASPVGDRRRGVHEHPALPALDRQLDQPVLVGVEALDALVARCRVQRAGEVVGPGVVRADDRPLGVAAVSLDELVCAVAAGVRERVDVVAVPGQQHVHVADHHGPLGDGSPSAPGAAQLVLATDAGPRAGEQVALLPREAPRRWCTPRRAASCELPNGCRVSSRPGQVESSAALAVEKLVVIQVMIPRSFCVDRVSAMGRRKVEVRREEILVATIAEIETSGMSACGWLTSPHSLGREQRPGLLPLRHQGRVARRGTGVRRRARRRPAGPCPRQGRRADSSGCAASSRRTDRPAPPTAGPSGSRRGRTALREPSIRRRCASWTSDGAAPWSR